MVDTLWQGQQWSLVQYAIKAFRIFITVDLGRLAQEPYLYCAALFPKNGIKLHSVFVIWNTASWLGTEVGDLGCVNACRVVSIMLKLYEIGLKVHDRRNHKSRKLDCTVYMLIVQDLGHSICISVLALFPTSPIFWSVPKLDRIMVSFANCMRTCSFSGVLGSMQKWQVCPSI